MKFTRSDCWIYSKISNRENSNHTHDIPILLLMLAIIMLKLLKVFNAMELHI